MTAFNVKTLSKNVLVLDNERSKGLKDERIEYPADSREFNSDIITSTFKVMHSDDMALNGIL